MKNHGDSKKTFYAWLPLALAFTVVCGLVEVSVQQNYRMSANDPQIQLSEDAAKDLNNGLPPEAITTQQPVDIAKSLSPFFLAYDEQGKPISGTAVLDGKLPSLPAGVFNEAKNGTKSFTWQPKKDIRQAVVLTPFKSQTQSASGTVSSSGFIAVSRSLREVEKRESALLLMVTAAWLIGLLLTYLAAMLAARRLMASHLEHPGSFGHAEHHEHHNHHEHVPHAENPERQE